MSVILDDDWADFFSYSKNKVQIQRDGYARVSYRVKGSPRKFDALHRMVIDAPFDKLVDHINGNKLDNRRANLRICTNAENLRNRGAQANSKSGVKGVSKTRFGRWQARGCWKRKSVHIGNYKTMKEAKIAVDAFNRITHGEFFRS